MIHGKRNLDILAELDGFVSGHSYAKKALISLINRSKIRHHQKWIEKIHNDYLITPHKLLLIGQSGTGKTHLVEMLQEVVDFPLIRLDATKLSPTGASGGVKEEEIRKMITKKAEEYCRTRKGYYHSVEGAIDQTVVFVDEIDKLGLSFDSSGNWNNHVQSNFLTLFDNKTEFSGVSFIFAGAFSKITGEEAKSVSTSIGFMNDDPKENSKEEMDLRIINAGLIPELVGRLTNIVELDKFTEEDFYDILLKRVIPKKLTTLAFFNIFNIELPEEQLRTIAKQAYKSGQGLRSLQRQLDAHYIDAEFENEYKGHKPKLLLETDDGELDDH